jgi:hypothetical protein
MKKYRTKSGTILTEEDLQRLADEAERGYCVAIVEVREGEGNIFARCFKPLPCPDHPDE